VNNPLAAIIAILDALPAPLLRIAEHMLRAILRGDPDAAARYAKRAALEQATARAKDEAVKRALR
jgi:hypothetical protein